MPVTDRDNKSYRLKYADEEQMHKATDFKKWLSYPKILENFSKRNF